MKRHFYLAGAVLILIALWSRGALAAQADAWKADWEKSVEAAKKEGQLTLYGSPDFEGLFGEFHKKYPEIKITGVFNRGADVAKRLMAERRADKYLADLYVNGMTTGYNVFYKGKVLDPIPPLLVLPEVTDSSKWWRGKLPFIDTENQYLFSINGENRMVVAFNTKLVNPAEIKSYWDLLNPKWKSKIEVRDIREAGPGAGNTRFFYYHADLGPTFIRKLFGEMDATLFRDFRQGPDWLATGKYAICFFCDVDVLKQQGLPVDTFGPRVFKEGGGLVQQFGTLALINRAPHPNAAKVFINWLLSRRGQIALQQTQVNAESPADSLRIDIPKDEVPFQSRRLDGIKYLDTGRPEWIEMKPILDVVNEALKAAGKN
jgi:iron(III) transport system substrate-binding protein